MCWLPPLLPRLVIAAAIAASACTQLLDVTDPIAASDAAADALPMADAAEPDALPMADAAEVDAAPMPDAIPDAGVDARPRPDAGVDAMPDAGTDAG